MGEYIGRINVSKDTMLFIVNTVFEKVIKEIAKRYGRIEDVTKGLIYTYGVVEFDFLRTKICKYMNEVIPEEELHDIYFKRLNLNLDVNYYNVRWTNTNEVQQFITYSDEEVEDVVYIGDAQKSHNPDTNNLILNSVNIIE